MREKLLDIMKSEGLKPSQLAERLEINPAGISHILAGRNKPSFDFLQKMLLKFPRLSPDWLLLDKGPMYRSDTTAAATGAAVNGGSPEVGVGTGIGAGAAGQTRAKSPAGTTLFGPAAGDASIATPSPASAGASSAALTSEALQQVALRGHGSVRRIVILYDDHTFESYTPSER